MSRCKGLLAAIWLLALPLGGCFKSDMPLIKASVSVTPVPEGRYTYIDDRDKSTKPVVITHDGAVTKTTWISGNASATIQSLLMGDLGAGFYLVMDDRGDYSLIHVHAKAILHYDESKYCHSPLGVARAAGKSISEYGVIEVTGGKSRTCKFDDLESIRRAMEVLVEGGPKLSSGATLVDLLVVRRI